MARPGPAVGFAAASSVGTMLDTWAIRSRQCIVAEAVQGARAAAEGD
jgi:hypothetical protein